MYTIIGRRAPAHATALGKAILAFLPPDAAPPILNDGTLVARTPLTITDPAVLAGIRCVGVPVRGPSGDVEAALSVAGSVVQLREEDTDQLARLRQGTACELSGRLGYVV